MTPTLTPITYQQARMMDRGMFTLFHAWDAGDEWRVEYWRGIEGNGACLRVLHAGDALRIVHFKMPGLAIHELRMWGYSIPGVEPLAETLPRRETPLREIGASA